MRKREIEIGGIYIAKISGRIVSVKILRESDFGGWDACNMQTGREVRIRTAARLNRSMSAERLHQIQARIAAYNEVNHD